jgi:hypothetical protein
MANSLTALNKAIWAKKMQIVRYKELVAMAITNNELRDSLKDGDTAHRPYRSPISGQTYTKGTDVSLQDVSATDETLVVNTAKVAPFYVDSVDEIQNSFDTEMDFRDDAMQALNQIVDADILAEYANATTDMYAATIGEVGATTPISVRTDNINKIFSKANTILTNKNVKLGKRFIVISPTMLETLQLYLSNKDTQFGDEVGNNGFVGKRFGFKIFLSTNLTSQAVWTPANNPSDAQTIGINGRTITFKTTLSGAEDEVKIGAATANTIDNLVDYLNGVAAGANWSAQSAATKAAFNGGMTATDGTTYLSIVFKGAGEMALATSDTADPWSTTIMHALAGELGAIDLVMQRFPQVEFRKPQLKLGLNVLPWMLYGKKTFNNQKDALIDINIDLSTLA